MKTISAALATARAQLTSIDAEVLLMAVLGCDRSRLLGWPEQTLTEDQQQQFAQSLARRIKGEPVAYITGRKGFWSLELHVNTSTLIPRPETELLVELALHKLPVSACKVIDLGTGTGAIALALAKERPQWQVFACDAQAGAVELAQYNALQHHLARVTIAQSNWFEGIDEVDFDLVVSNPPYIDSADPHLQRGDVRFEPRTALVAADGGLADIACISRQARTHLKSGGWLMLEHGYHQGEVVRAQLSQEGYSAVETHCDLAGHERVTTGQYIHG